MEANRLKSFVKLVVILLGISFFFIACQEETIKPMDEQNSPGFKIETIHTKQIQQNRELIENLKFIEQKTKPKAENTMARQIYDSVYGFTIDTSIAQYIEYGNYHSYTFSVERDVDNGLTENLFLSLQNDGSYKAFLVSYNLTPEERDRLLNSEDIDLSEEGKIEWQEIDINPDNVFQRNVYLGDGVYYNDELDYCYKEIWVISKATGWLEPSENQIDCPEEAQDYIDSGLEPGTGGGNWDDNPSDGNETPPLDGSGGGGDGTGGNTGDPNQPDPNDDPNNPEEPTDCLQLDENGDCIGDITSPLVVDSKKKECNKIKKLFEDYSNLLNELQTLKEQTNLSQERGKYVIQGAGLLQNAPVGSSGFVEISTELGNPYLFVAHTHNSPSTSTYSIFSWADLEGIYELIKKGKIVTSRFVYFLFTADGTNYAITISDLNKFRTFFATVDDTEYFDMQTALNRVDLMNDYYENKPPLYPIITENSINYVNDQKAFLDLINDNGLGLTLFEATDTNLTSFAKLTHNKTTNNVDRDNCNN